MLLTINAIQEEKPGPKWQELFDGFWPGYKEWFLSEGHLARPGYMTSLKNLRRHMPELVPIYEQLAELAGGGDLAARFLSMYCPPPYLAGCSQAVWLKGEPFLVRNYDYDPKLYDGILLRTNWRRPVIAMVDCLWGALDGMNDAGLVASLAFGGRKMVGEGFGVPLILRYLLEVCDTTDEAKSALQRIPSHMPYNVTVLDRTGTFTTAFLSPDRPPVFVDDQVITNFQGKVEWQEYAQFTASVERKEYLDAQIANGEDSAEKVIGKFLKPPLYNTKFEKGFGTLYTAIYQPGQTSVDYIWPGKKLAQSLANFSEQKMAVNLQPTRASFKKRTVS